MHSKRFPCRCELFCEPLETRRLLAWGAEPHLIQQDVASDVYPDIKGQGVTVAVIDTGIDYTQPALGGAFGPGHKVKGGHDFVDNDDDPMDTFGHGTNVAGVIAADPFTINGEQYSGIAPQANLVALRVSSDGQNVSSQTIEAALKWIEDNRVAMGISVINFSFGAGSHNSPFTDPVVSDDLATLKAAGVLFVSPSGNGGVGAGEGIEWPAADPSVVPVGSVATNDTISTFTQRGDLLHLLAPGEDVGTTSKNGGFTLISLSSFSSPVVAGIAALMKQADPTLKAADMTSILMSSGKRIDDSAFGFNAYSRVNVFNAVTNALRRAPNAGTDVGVNGAASDMAFDSQDVLHFAYYDQVAHTIRYATRSAQGAWSATRIIDKTGDDVGGTLSLAIDPTDHPSIAYYDGTLGDLIYSRFDGVNWKHATLDSKNVVGQFPSLAFDPANGQPVVAYYRKTSADLRVMRSDGRDVEKRTEPDTAGVVGQFPSIAFARNGTLGVAYSDVTNGDLKYAQWNGSSWDPEIVDNRDVIAWPSLAYDAANHPAISYYDASPADLRFASKASGTWVPQVLSTKGAQGLFTNLWFDETDQANVLYFSRKSNAVFLLFGPEDGSNWQGQTVKLTGGSNLVATVTADGTHAAYAYFDTTRLKLMTGDLL